MDRQHDFRLLARMLVRIAAIVFLVEAVVMVMLSGWQFTPDVVVEGLIDATALTLLASPAIYVWAVKPYAVAAHEAQSALSHELEVRAEQSARLQSALDELKALLAQNEQLRARVQKSSAEFSSINERTLLRIGADLHDGPAQLLSYALLRLHRFLPSPDGAGTVGQEDRSELEAIRSALVRSLREVRDISSGLALPELEQRSLTRSILLAIGEHEERTDTTASFEVADLPDVVDHALKVCAYRFVQEGLNNASRHSRGDRLRVGAMMDHNDLVIRVNDNGAGIRDIDEARNRGLGLPGLRGRVEALGGTFRISSELGAGTEIVARIPAVGGFAARTEDA